MQLQEHQPQQRVQRRQREHRDHPQGQESQRERREDSSQREQRGTRETIQETSYKTDRGNQTDASQPSIYPDPETQLLPFLSDFIGDFINDFIFWIFLPFAALCVGFLIWQVIKWRAPRANEALDLAIRVFALEVGRFLFKPVNQLMKFWAHVVSTYGGFWEHVLFLVMLTILIAHYGQMYILREEYVLLVLDPFLLPSLCFLLILVRWHYLANRFL